ncbi:MAG: DsbE family thiol:disulfide interchange protein [Rhodospirillales bacterium]
MRKLLYFIPALIMAGLGAAFYLQLGKDASVVPSALIDRAAPEFALDPIEGHDRPGLASADFRGQVTVVNVFASWCLPCRAEHPLVMALAERDDIQVAGLNYKDKPEDARRWLAELGDPYDRIGADQTGRVGIDFGVYGVPETFVIDRNGVVRFKHVGPLTEEHVRKSILPAIEALQK